ncbi:hypothetical protein MRX96_016820 [Rhipicephalus microplus]
MTTGRNGMGKFWSYMASLDRKAPMCELRDENMKEKVEVNMRHLTAHIRRIYDSTQPHDWPTPPTACGTINPEDSLWKVARLAIDHAISKISSKTAKGLDGIAARLVKCLANEPGNTWRRSTQASFKGTRYQLTVSKVMCVWCQNEEEMPASSATTDPPQ